MKDYSEYIGIINQYIESLKELAETPEDVDTLETEDNKLNFIELFKNILRVMNKLETFSRFDFL